jgi:hypothetical protein
MDLTALMQSIDEEIVRLEKIRALLTDHAAPLKRTAPKRRRVSEEGRARMGAAQKARWAKAKRK